MSLDNISDDELKDELERREEAKRVKDMPKPLEEPDFKDLKKQCHDHLLEIATEEGEGDDDDAQHYIYEAAMEAFYGPDVWKFINERELS